jgi:hypothetical protein
VTSSGIVPATFRFVAQYHSHRATACPHSCICQYNMDHSKYIKLFIIYHKKSWNKQFACNIYKHMRW